MMTPTMGPVIAAATQSDDAHIVSSPIPPTGFLKALTKTMVETALKVDGLGRTEYESGVAVGD
jgi:hypothetical protein